MPKLVSLFALVFVCLAGVSGCNTLEGAGEDIEEAGETVEDSADDS